MPLAPGTKLGHYSLTELIGRGGMGEVYKALDTKLNRHVALKVLPGALANNPERMARFQREAQLLASLNHPNIAAIYGLEDSGSHWAIVMELVEGDTLKGPIPIPEVLRLAKQIADAVEYAHDKTVIHRDLKPANIKVTPEGQVKVLDFGLAKALDDAGSSHPETNPMDSMSPTLTMGGTAAGVILGTAAYMAPEQAKGKRADRKADIWSFGVVLYEMLTGKRVFAGETMAETLASVMKEQLTFDDLPKETPSALRKLVARCLDRDLKRRVQSMGEVRIALEDLLSGAATEEVKVVTQQAPAKTSWLPWAAAGAFALSTALVAWAPWKTPPTPPEVVRLEINAPEKTTFNNAILLSPDGRHLAFTSSNPDGGIWVRSLDTLQARRIASWTGNPVPFWSADSRFIAYQQDGKLKKVALAGGPPITLSDAPTAFAGGAWNQDNVIVFGDRGGGLKQVSASGGVPTPLTKLDEKSQEIGHGLPSFLPDGKHFLYHRRSSKPERSGVYIGSLGVAPEQQDAKLLFASETAAIYTPALDPRTGAQGFLLFLREGTLMAQPFDAAGLALKGEPIPVAEQVGTVPAYSYGKFSVSANGALAYTAAGIAAGAPTRLTWFDRQGKNLGVIGNPGSYDSLALSPDGSRVAAGVRTGAGLDLWLIDSAPGGKSDRFTFGQGAERSPVWSPDGSQIAFSSDLLTIFQKPSNLGGSEVELFKSGEQKDPSDWSRDGKTLLFTSISGQPDLWTLNVADKKAEVFLKTESPEMLGKLSPDGHWLAYVSNATGRSEIYVRPFPVSAERTGQQMVSNGGGAFPYWRKDGKELYYVSPAPSRAVMAVDVTTGPLFKAGPPKQLFPQTFDIAPISGLYYQFAAAPDGQRFLFNVAGGDSGPQTPITVVLNWTSGLK